MYIILKKSGKIVYITHEVSGSIHFRWKTIIEQEWRSLQSNICIYMLRERERGRGVGDGRAHTHCRCEIKQICYAY